MPTLKGKWKFNDIIVQLPPVEDLGNFYEQNINFTTNGVYLDNNYQVEANKIIYYWSGIGYHVILTTPLVEEIQDTDVSVYNKIDERWDYGNLSQTVDFGSEEQQVSQEFYEWFTANAVEQDEPETPDEPETSTESITITYDGRIIATLTEGQSVTLHTNGKKAKTDIVVSMGEYANLITFTVWNLFYTEASGTFQAEEGMTWTEWIESEYNTDGWFIQPDGTVRVSSTEYLCAKLVVMSVDVVIPDYKYYRSHHLPTN